MSKNEVAERTILITSFTAGLLFAIVEFLMGIYSQSQSVLMDAAYDSSELIIIGFNLFLMPLFHKPATEKHPFGYLQVESIFVIIKGFMMMGITLGLSANNVILMMSGGNNVDGEQISYFQLFLGVLCLFVYLYVKKLGKKLASPTIKAELYGWKIDIYYSGAMALAFFVSTLFRGTRFAPFLPYFDQVVAIGIAISVLPELLRIIITSVRDIFLFAPEKEVFDKIKEITENVLENYMFNIIFLDVTRTGRKIWISVYFETKQKSIYIPVLQSATQELNLQLRKEIKNCEAELIINA